MVMAGRMLQPMPAATRHSIVHYRRLLYHVGREADPLERMDQLVVVRRRGAAVEPDEVLAVQLGEPARRMSGEGR